MSQFDYLFRPSPSNEKNLLDEFRLDARLWGRISDRLTARGGAMALFLDRNGTTSTANLLRQIAAEANQPAKAEGATTPNRAYLAKLRSEQSPDRFGEEEVEVMLALAEFLERNHRGVFVDRSPHDDARANRATYGGSRAEARAEKRSASMAFAHGRLPE